MGLSKKMEWLKWIKKYSGMLDTKKTSSMETLIESASSKPVNYAYNYSSAITDDEFTGAAAPQHPQRPMLPPPPQVDIPPTPPTQQLNDIYDCCVLLDGIPIKHEFKYTLSDIGGHGKITKDDIEGLASKILESMYGTTAKFSPGGQRTIIVTLNVVRQSWPIVVTDSAQSWSQLQSGRERKNKVSSTVTDKQQSELKAVVEPVATAAVAESVSSEMLLQSDDYPTHCPVKKISSHHRAKPEMRWYNRRDELIRLLQKNLAESLSFQNLRKSNNRPEGYHRVRTKRRQSISASVVGTLQTTPLPSPPTSVYKPKQPAKVDWSPYDFEPVAHIPSHHHHHQQRRNARNQHHHHQQQQQRKQQLLYVGKGGGGGTIGQRPVEDQYAIKSSPRAGQQQHYRTAVSSKPKDAIAHGAIVSSKSKDAFAAEEYTKNVDHQRYKRAKMASKKMHHHTHEHHHYHHYDYYIV